MKSKNQEIKSVHTKLAVETWMELKMIAISRNEKLGDLTAKIIKDFVRENEKEILDGKQSAIKRYF